jgi:hypothetical protein
MSKTVEVISKENNHMELVFRNYSMLDEKLKEFKVNLIFKFLKK